MFCVVAIDKKHLFANFDDAKALCDRLNLAAKRLATETPMPSENLNFLDRYNKAYKKAAAA
jgi:hypothetical protein